MNFSKKQLGILAAGFFICLSLPVAVLWKKVDLVTKMSKAVARRQNSETLALNGVTSSLGEMMHLMGKTKIPLPGKLVNVPCAYQLGIVKKVRTLDLDPVFAPYNGSIIEKEDGGYHLVFRYDLPKDLWNVHPFYSHVGYAELDADFSAVRVVEKINTKSLYSEDPRIIRVGKDHFLVWNDKVESEVYCRTMHTGRLNVNNCKLDYITDLDQHIKPVEKNWAPFERWEGQEPHLGFVYGIYPHKILDVPYPHKNVVNHLISKNSACRKAQEWQNQWGAPYGGTPPRLIDDEYLSFFHSWFREGDKIWYAMGAYTFEKEAPYKITSITAFPILFPGIYDSEYINTADPNKYTIYPAGVAVEKKGKKILLHVSCGENDAAVKVVTIDYEKLRRHMVSAGL